MSPIINGFILFSLTITCAFFLGLVSFLTGHGPHSCEMTYMFEYPQFVKISQKLDEKYPQYGLFVYSEGRLTERSRNMYFDGIPVLFIPGNAGSHRQARSLASVALRKALNSRTPFHFDHYMIDLNKEFSGLNGALLSQQLEYANGSLYRILDLYKDRKNPPKSVILYAHSVGGIIARRLVESLKDSTLVPIIVTTATPHKRLPLMLDSFMFEFYQNLNTTHTRNITFISIAGGFNDFLVPTYLAGHSENSLDVATTQIPRAWLSCDHVSIMWCKQVILAINRALFDCVDPKTKHISNDVQFRKRIFHHHLVNHNGLNPFVRHDLYSGANIRNTGEWIEFLDRQFIIKVPKNAKGPYFYMVRLVPQPLHEGLRVVALNLKTTDWVFVCGAHIPRDNFRVCEDFHHLSELSELSPSVRHKRRSISLNLHELIRRNENWTHVILRALPSDNDVELHVDVYRVSDRQMAVVLPHPVSFKRQVILNETPEKAIHYELLLPTLSHVIQSYQLFVEPQRCGFDARQATASLIVPWSNHNQHKHFVHDDERPMNVWLYESKPKNTSEAAMIRLTLDPNCRYKISIRSYIPGILSQLARLYSPLLIANVAAVVLMTLNAQLKSLGKDRNCSLFIVALAEGAKPYYILTTVKLLSRFLSSKQFLHYFPAPDWSIMSDEGVDFFLLPLILYVTSVGITWILGILLGVSLVLCETTVNKLALKFLAKTVSFTITWSDYIMSALHKVPIFVAAFLITLTVTTTGSLALCVGTVFYFLRLTQMSQDYVEELVWYYVKKIGEKLGRTNNNNNNNEVTSHSVVFFHCTIFMLWCIITAINIPSVLTWAHNYKFGVKLEPDPSFVPGLILSVCAAPLWQLEIPKTDRKWYNEMGLLVSMLATVSLIYAPISIFRLNYTIMAAIILVTLHQLVAPLAVVSEEQRTTTNWYDTIKAKLE